MSDYSTVVAAMELLLGNTTAVQILKGWEADYGSVAAERDAAVNRAAALEKALERSEAFAADLVTTISKVREDAADGVLDNPIPEDPAPVEEVPVEEPAPVEEVPVEPAPVEEPAPV